VKTLTLTSLAAITFLSAASVASAAPGDTCGKGPGFGGPGFAGPDFGGPARLMEKFDTNKDGKITQDEIDAIEAKDFSAANKDGQGGVTIQEFEPYFWAQHREMMVRAFQRLDRDGDGQISKDEMAGRSEGLVSRLDRNGDKALSKDDLPPPPAPGEGPRGWMKWGGHDGEGHGFGRKGHGPGMMNDCGPGQGPASGMSPADNDEGGEGGPQDAAPAQ
jgi:hypothetical protein